MGARNPPINHVKNIKIKKDLSQIECFQCFLSTKNSNSVYFSFEIKCLHRIK